MIPEGMVPLFIIMAAWVLAFFGLVIFLFWLSERRAKRRHLASVKVFEDWRKQNKIRMPY